MEFWMILDLFIIQLLSSVWLFVTPWTVACQTLLPLHYLPEFSQTHAHWVSDAIHPSYPLLPPFPPVFNLPQDQGFFFFFNESPVPIRWPKFWSLSFSIRASNEYSELISYRVDWYDILAVKGSLKSLLQHHNSKGSTLKHSAFFMLQLSHLYMATRKKTELWLHRPFIAKWC